MSAESKPPTEAHAPTQASGPQVYGLFPADFTYRISNGVITPYGATADTERTGSFDDELDHLGFPHVATVWGVSGSELTTRLYERHPGEGSPGAPSIAERVLIVVALNCVERYYLASDLHDALPFLAQIAATSVALAQSMTALHQREERLRREALISGLAGSMEQISKALRAYVATEMFDDTLARDEAPQEGEVSTLASDTILTNEALARDLHSSENGSDTTDTLLTDLLRRRSRQRKNTTND